MSPGTPKWLRSVGGKVLRVAVPGVRQVHAQVAPYAKAWDAANASALTGAGPLWVVLGDSTAQGIGAPAYDKGYVGQLRAVLDEHSSAPWRVLNFSRSGAKAADVLETQLPRLKGLEQPPELVTCAIGANDMMPTPLDQVLASMREIIRRLPKGGVIATIPQGLRPPHAVAVNEVIRGEAPAAGLVVADVWAHTGPPWRGNYAPDGFHPGLTGYANWAKAFAEALVAAPGPWADST